MKTSPDGSPTRKFRLRTTLVVPFVLQVVTIVGLVGYLSFRNGQRSVNDLASQLSDKVTGQINQHLESYLEKPHLLQGVLANAFRHGNLNPDDFPALERQFWSDIQLTDAVDYVYIGKENGDFMGVQRYLDGKLVVKFRDQTTAPNRVVYEVKQPGDRIEQLQSKPYDPRNRPWYGATIAAKAPIWSSIFTSANLGVLQISPTTPIYDAQGKLVGVLATNLLLEQINQFLNELPISKSGDAFIIERSGDLVASSTDEIPSIAVPGEEEPVRLNALKSKEPVIQQTAQYLQDQGKGLSQIQQSKQFRFVLNGSPQLVQVSPMTSVEGLDWLIVVVIPESDFMEQIYQNNHNTGLLMVAALGIAIVIGIRTAHWITRPLLWISKASEELAKGNLAQRVDGSHIVEVDTLSQAFNSMAGQLQDSFTALRQSEARNRALLEAIPDLMLEIDRDGVYLDCIEAKEITLINRYQPQDLVGQRIQDMLPDDLVQNYLNAIQQAIDTQETQTLEYQLQVEEQWHTYESRIVASSDRAALFMVRDITKRKQAEEALRLLNEELEARVERRTNELRKEKERSEQLLLNVLPAPIAERLKKTSEAPAEHFEEASILFADIVGFTSLSARMEPMSLVTGLNHIFSAFDQLTEKYGLEKIKTIGDAYMVVGGLPIPKPDHATAIANMAIDMQAHMQTLHNFLGESLQIRIGINTGPVIAGVIGIKKFIYDLWGDAVNVASRMESHGEPGYIQVTEATYVRLQDQFIFKPRGTISVKGRGEMTTYWLLGRRST